MRWVVLLVLLLAVVAATVAQRGTQAGRRMRKNPRFGVLPKFDRSNYKAGRRMRGRQLQGRMKSKCGETYTLNADAKIKFKYPKKRRDYECRVDYIIANAETQLQLQCRKFKLKPCRKEYLNVADIDINNPNNIHNSSDFCSKDKVDLRMQGNLVLNYARIRRKPFRGSKMRCVISGIERTVITPTVSTTTESTTTVSTTTNGPGNQPCPNTCGTVKSFTGGSKIVGGSPAKLGQYPWMAHLIVKVGSRAVEPNCSASILNSRTLLTAAHCLDSANITGVEVTVGAYNLSKTEPNQQTFNSSSHVLHELYNKTTLHNDIAIIRLSEDIVFSEDVKPICICVAGPGPIPDGALTNVSGWGSISKNVSAPIYPDVLHHVQVEVKNHAECAKNYTQVGDEIIDTQICASAPGKDSCIGDSGGPLIFEQVDVWHQVGIVSYGQGCAEPMFPGVYTKVCSYKLWILEHFEPGNCE